MGSKGSNTTQTSTTTRPDDQAYQMYSDILNRAQGVASTPYQAYGGELTAGINGQQTAGIGGINNYANAAQNNIGQATNLVQGAASPLTQSQIQNYMSPYTQNVVDATQAQFNNQNKIGQQQTIGNTIAQNALGGNRSAIAQAQTAGQQQMAQAPVIAGLYDKAYQGGLNTAYQQYQQNPMAAGSMLGNLGVAGQTAGLQGAGAQIGAGTLQQGTQQASDTANYGQYQNAQAYPYQQLQWLAGLGTGVGSQMGGTSNGTTTAPQPNSTSQWLGLGAAGIGAAGQAGLFSSLAPMLAFSDERLKENVESIGKTHDGQTIYRYNFKGHPQTHIGLIAQDVEKKTPEAVHNVGGYKAVDYDAATEDSVRRAQGGVVGYAGGGWADGVAGVPFSGAKGYIPNANITHGAGAPPARVPAAANTGSGDLSKQAASIGDLAKSIKGIIGGGSNPLEYGQSLAGAEGPTAAGGPQGPAPLQSAGANDFYGGNGEYGGNFAQPLPGLSPGDYGMMARGGVAGYADGGVAGYEDGGTPTFQDRWDGAPDDPDAEPTRLYPKEMQEWRDSVDHPNAALIADASPQGGGATRTAARAPSGVAPASDSTAMAFSGEPASGTSDLPSEVALGYSSTGRSADGVAPPDVRARNARSMSNGEEPSGKPGIDFSSEGKLWPSLMSAGFGMMASRSPNLGVAIGEGGQAGINSYNKQQEAAFEAQKFAEQQSLRERQEDRQQSAADRESATASLIPDGKGGYKVNPAYISLKKAENAIPQPMSEYQKEMIDRSRREEALKLKTPVKVMETRSGTPIMAMPQLNTKTNQVDLYPIGADGKISTTPLAPGASIWSDGVPAGVSTTPATDSTTPPAAPGATAAPAATKTVAPEAAPHPANSAAPAGTEASRNTAFLDQIKREDPRGGSSYAQLVKKAADYELDPAKIISMRTDKRQRFIQDVMEFDPSYNPNDATLRYKAQASFLPGTKNGDTITAFNTAISHLDTLKQMYKALNNGDVQLLNKAKNTFQQQFGYAAPNDVSALASIIGGEVVKATVGAQNALGDREEVRHSISRDLSLEQADSVIEKYQRLMAGQLYARKHAYEQGTGLKNFEEKFLLPRSREILHEVGESEGSGGKPTMTAQDKAAMDWANANPKDPRAAAIKKRLGQ